MLTDLRVGFRLFMRRPGLALAAVLSLALGIGANTAIFSVLHNVVLNPLPYDDPERLAIIWETRADNPERWVAPANFVDWRRDSRSFASLAAFDEFAPTLSGRGEPERLRALGASGTFFTTLGVSAALGRTLLPSDDEPGANDVAVLSHGLWNRLYGGTPDVLGRSAIVDGRPYTIVGVMPPSFESPLQSAIDIWLSGDRGVPRTFPFGGDLTAVRDSHIIFVVGRLAPGATERMAQDELTGMMEELARRYPDTNAGLGVNVRSLHEQVVGNVRRVMLLLQLAVGMMLLIACANVAHLLLGQAAGRQGEMMTRAALGAGRARLVRQMLAETLVIAIPGGLVGLLLAVWGVDAIVAAAPSALPRIQEIAVDPTVLGFTTSLTLLTATLFGLGPALQLARHRSLAEAHASFRLTGGQHVRRWHHAIVVAELALAQVLLVGAGLLMASFLASQRVPLGFQTEGRVAADLSLSPDKYLRPIAEGAFQIDPTAKIAFVNDVLARVQAAPYVRGAAASFTSPLTGAPNRGISIEGRPSKGPGNDDAADFQLVTPDFFRAVGVTLVRGRAFSAEDRADRPSVAVVNQTFADRFFPGEDPIGRRLRFGGNSVHEIVGMVADMRYRYIESAPDPTFYVPITQNAERWPFLSFTVWTDGNATAGLSQLRDAIRAADSGQAITRIRSYDDILRSSLAARRFNTMLVVAFASAALLLAAIGIYGVMAYAVSVRTRELGVRAALGAAPGDLLRLVVGQGALLTAIAVTLGVGVGLMLTRLMASMLYDVTPRDPGTFATVAALLTVVALLATWLPARRAIRVNPITALRDE
jgi:putative ABC transport system permease protein